MMPNASHVAPGQPPPGGDAVGEPASRQDFLGTLLDYTSDLVCATDEEGHIVYANAALTRATGFTAAELALLRPVDLIATHDEDAFTAAAKRVRSGETVRDGEWIVVARDGHQLIVRGQAVPILSPTGMVTGARIIFRDVTSEREAEQPPGTR